MNIVGEIRYFLGEGQYASLKFSESVNAFSIDIVMVPVAHRGRGIGSELIKRILLLADSTRKEIYVSARPLAGADEEKLMRLVEYYRRFGFEIIDRGLTVVYMIRKPAA